MFVPLRRVTLTHSKKMHGKSRIPSLGVADRLVCLAMKVTRRLRLRTLTWRLYQLHWRAAKMLLAQTLSRQLAKYSSVRPQTSPPPREIFNLWFQGFSDVPPIVRICTNRAGRLGLRQVLLDDANVETLGIDEVMVRKHKEGKISMQTWSDIIRTYLLSHRGGVWADASLYVSKLPEDALAQPFYSCRHRVADNFVENPSIFRAQNGQFESKWTFFFLASHKGDVVTSWLYDCFTQYWRVWDAGVDYFLCDMILRLGYEEVPAVRREIDAIVVNNDGALYALRHILSQEFDPDKWQKWGQNTLNVFKLDWRIGTDAMSARSYFGRLKEELH